ncbi:U11/U12 small nuclear ribonucleoprotein 48 kDa protein isoform X1 [Hippocampus comes]|uniref:U11/U12 small nuclear ribonucleoprotein 48 kDa protein isoform X1 n=1 Tax=Hippocampus comes TaxID=109280 RepID=UPI00094E29ED|nr:PREDICTED: U11/U12 small nuclear ribonucleoprotein 48 kDa protein isoform X1 [Hippocampus comes]XP_019719412.1 PREDICTED: U11/U12 small nuclear ribonucleoprotein 48 kDa protein isoform X1 [Hippocampus comes]
MSESLKITTMRERMDRLQELVEFTKNCQKQIQDMYDALGWSQDNEQHKEPMELCPYDPGHRVPVRSMERHKASCYLTKMGYSSEEQAEICDTSPSYINTSIRSLTMDKSLQNQVILQARAAAPLMKMEGVFWQGHYSYQPVDVPQNHKRAVCDLTVADRLALYDHVIGVLNQEKAVAASGNEELYVDLVSKLKKAEEQNEPKTHLELMAEMRDYKRRRQSYRAKNVHITKKSYTEVIREVIQVHSEELARQWKDEHEEEDKEKEDQDEAREGTSQSRRRLDERRSLSSESRRSRTRHRRSREKSRERESKKKKRKRVSRSPDKHHDSKKKKKKRKDERGRSDSS